jgi:hypothetical protein
LLFQGPRSYVIPSLLGDPDCGLSLAGPLTFPDIREMCFIGQMSGLNWFRVEVEEARWLQPSVWVLVNPFISVPILFLISNSDCWTGEPVFNTGSQ